MTPNSPTSEDILTLPDSLPERLAIVGQALHGEDWHGRIADGLGVHRATLWRWMSGKRPMFDVDHDIIQLLELEIDLQDARAKRISALRRLFFKRATTTDR